MCGMNHRQAVLTLFTLYCGRTGKSAARVSTLIWNHGGRQKRIQEGGDLTTRSYERACQWFSDRWPADLDWPEDIPRPAPNPDRDAA